MDESFLITFKPATESENGWPIESLLALKRQIDRSGRVTEPWRFQSTKRAYKGATVFLLCQGKLGPAIIGLGVIANAPQDRQADVEFTRLVDPTLDALVGKEELRAIPSSQSLWRTQASGVSIPAPIAKKLAELLPKDLADAVGFAQPKANPDWARDEHILALDLYLQDRLHPPGKHSAAIAALSDELQLLARLLFPGVALSDTFRNANGVYMKLMNFRRLDPLHQAKGNAGLAHGSGDEQSVWDDFADSPEACASAAAAIRLLLNGSPSDDPETPDWVEEAPEGRLLSRAHTTRERSRRLVEQKKSWVLSKLGALQCEACGFDFSSTYGERGGNFIECHHVVPLHSLAGITRTRKEDLALVCANCHRMIHRTKQWLTLADLQLLIRANR
jgi:5-methylcytosine-specific restriction protein A